MAFKDCMEKTILGMPAVLVTFLSLTSVSQVSQEMS
jgi:hypothetical protein